MTCDFRVDTVIETMNDPNEDPEMSGFQSQRRMRFISSGERKSPWSRMG